MFHLLPKALQQLIKFKMIQHYYEDVIKTKTLGYTRKNNENQSVLITEKIMREGRRGVFEKNQLGWNTEEKKEAYFLRIFSLHGGSIFYSFLETANYGLQQEERFSDSFHFSCEGYGK